MMTGMPALKSRRATPLAKSPPPSNKDKKAIDTVSNVDRFGRDAKDHYTIHIVGAWYNCLEERVLASSKSLANLLVPLLPAGAPEGPCPQPPSCCAIPEGEGKTRIVHKKVHQHGCQ